MPKTSVLEGRYVDVPQNFLNKRETTLKEFNLGGKKINKQYSAAEKLWHFFIVTTVIQNCCEKLIHGSLCISIMVSTWENP